MSKKFSTFLPSLFACEWRKVEVCKRETYLCRYPWLLKSTDVLVGDEVYTLARPSTQSSQKGLIVNSRLELSEAFKEMALRDHRDLLEGIRRIGEYVRVKGRACPPRVSLVGQSSPSFPSAP